MVAILGLAVALGAVSWWYRFESAHRATEFWGPVAAELIAEPSQVLGLKLEPISRRQMKVVEGDVLTLGAGSYYEIKVSKDLTDAPGMVHLRHALLTDSNYLWMQRPEDPDAWRWMLKFSRDSRYILILFSEDLATLGKSTDASSVRAISCQPMAETLREYFAALGLASEE